MSKALIGYTGFVGSNLMAQSHFDAFYNSKNITDIQGKSFDMVYCAGVSATKWLANKEPAQDWQAIQKLIDQLDTIHTKKFVLISTVDVYARPVQVDEDTPIDAATADAYGRHRYQLEEYVQEKFDATIIRLPGLFGKGLKKNVIYDFLHNNCLELIHQGGVFQFYNLDHLSKDIEKVLENNIPLINFATENISVQQLVDQVFHNNFSNSIERVAPYYDLRSKYAHLWGQQDYLYTREQVLDDIKNFVATSKISL